MLSTSIMLERVKRAMRALCPTASVATGMMKCRQLLAPCTGKTRKPTANISISIKPSQKVGIEKKNTVTTMPRLSTQVR